MESKNGFPNPTFQQSLNPLKDLMMEGSSAVDPKVNSEEKSSIFTHHNFFRNALSHNSFKLSTVKDVKVRMQEKAKNVKASRVIILVVILTIIGVFSIPVILFSALKTDPLPASEFTDVNISMVNLLWSNRMYVVNRCIRDGMVQNLEIWIHCPKIRITMQSEVI